MTEPPVPPTRDELDAWFPDRPVWITRVCNHVGLANSAALRAAGVRRDTPAPPGGEVRRDDSGELTGPGMTLPCCGPARAAG